MVLHAIEELGLVFEERNVADRGVADELIARGGRKQTPYLVDTETDTELYGSAKIVEYIMQRYGAQL